MKTAAAGVMVVGAAWLCAGAHGQDLGRRPGPQEAPVAIVNGTVHTVSGGSIERGYVLFEKGRITGVGAMAGAAPFGAGVQVVEAAGKHVYPGLISPTTELGLSEITAVKQMMDVNEAGEITPEAFAAVSVNPDSTLLPVTRTNGVLIAGVFPGGGVIPGRASVMRMEGWTWEDMTVKREAGLVVSWPQMRTISAPWMDQNEDEQRRATTQRLDTIRETFKLARAYRQGKGANPATPTDLRWEAVAPVFGGAGADGAGKMPLFVSAQDFDQITSAVGFCVEQGLACVIVGGRDAVLCADLLKKHDVPVIVNTIIALPSRDDSAYDANYVLPARLKALGVRFCIASGEEVAHERNLPYAAAMAAAHGLDMESAIRSVTQWPAEILGVGSVVGTLDAGKEATLIVTT
ncbi:MAG: amidohydrolase family protein, partial [Phycisphaerales bacterium]